MGRSQALTPNTFVRSGYILAGWSTTGPNGPVVYFDGSQVTLTTNITLWAIWTPANPTVTFIADGRYRHHEHRVLRQWTVAGLNAEHPRQVGLLVRRMEHHRSERSGRLLRRFASHLDNQHHPLAIWTANVAPATDTISFNSEGGSAVSSISGLTDRRSRCPERRRGWPHLHRDGSLPRAVARH